MFLFVEQTEYEPELKNKTMKAALKVRKQEIKGSTYLVKLRIDHKTVITVRTKESLKNWKSKYPDAVELL